MSSEPMAATAPLSTITMAHVREARAQAVTAGRPWLVLLGEQTGLDEEAVALSVAALFRFPYLNSAQLGATEPDFEALPAPDAARRGCLIAKRGEKRIAVIADPTDDHLRSWLTLRARGGLDWYVASAGEIAAYLTRHEQDLRTVTGGGNAQAAEIAIDSDIENLSLASISADGSPVVKLVHSTIYDALRSGASDIHLETRPAGLTVRYRLDGVLVPVLTAPGPEFCEQVISRIKVMSELDIAERRVPQDGRFKIAMKGRPIDFRVSVIPSVHGEDAVLRILDKQALTDEMRGLRLDGLGFDDDIVLGVRRLSQRPYGMLLVTGPTGSGKTTTLYAAISETNTGLDKIVTIEDPVEYQLPGVLQIPVNEKKGLTFARGLRSILRHDPDKIMVGEIRDSETAQIAIQSALTGHLVFTTVHANNVFDVLGRFAHMEVDSYAFVSALNGILAQRLMRVICEHCGQDEQPSPELIADSMLTPEAVAGWHFRTGRGCAHCRGTGYKGRKAIGELLTLSDELREAIVEHAPARKLKELAAASGARLMRETALDLVARGVTTLKEANRVTAMA